MILSPRFSPTESVDPGTPLVVQMHSSDPAACWTNTFDAASITKNDGEKPKAKLK